MTELGESPEQWTALIRLSRGDAVLFEGEIGPSRKVKLTENLDEPGMTLEVLWIRHHWQEIAPPDAKTS